MARRLRYAPMFSIAFALFCAASVALWTRGHRSARTFQVRLPIGLSQFRSDHGWFTLDNEPQRDEEIAAETDDVQQRWSTAYLEVQNDYIASGRDLSDPSDAHQATMREAFDDHLRDLHRLEFEYKQKRENVDARWRVHPIRRWKIRCVVVAAGSGIVPAMYGGLFLVSQWTRRRRRRQNRCVTCGYDLRASPGRCPECGREATRMLIP